MKITTEMVKELREVTGAGVLEAKKALEANAGDFKKAESELLKKGAAQAAKRVDRQASEGVIEVYAHPGSRIAVMLELNCETDFVARNEIFQQLAHDLALHIAAMNPRYIRSEDVPPDVVESETQKARGLAEGKPENVAENIVAGRLRKYYEENCLLEQRFVKDEDKKVKDIIDGVVSSMREKIVLRRFIRYELGEDL